jgi:acetyltransferase-like isoleucine patch superfamily enzyme
MLIGKYTYGKPKVHWEGPLSGQLIIGNFCSIADHCNIYLGGNHRVDWVTTYPFGHISQSVFDKFDGQGHPSTKGDVTIGSDVWIGEHVTIMSGVTIGDGVVIANNSHVVKSAEPYSIIGGNPAKLIRKRFPDRQIEQLLDIKWWNWDDQKINELSPLLCNPDIEQFIHVARSP